MDDTQNAPVEETITTDAGQAQKTVESATTDVQPEVSFENRANSFYQKKGWDPEKGPEQLLNSYEELESKLGNFKDIEQKAQLFEQLGINPDELQQLRTKAQQYDAVQKEIEEFRLNQRLNESPDYSTFTNQELAQFWKNGKVSLADLPAQRQYEVQKYVAEQDAQSEREYEQNARALAEKYPEVSKDPDLINVVAAQIEAGVDPERAFKMMQDKIRDIERKSEEKIRADVQRLKQSGVERTTSGVSTVSNEKAKSVRDAFKYAQQVHSS